MSTLMYNQFTLFKHKATYCLSLLTLKIMGKFEMVAKDLKSPSVQISEEFKMFDVK